jgi:hypothetical protein
MDFDQIFSQFIKQGLSVEDADMAAEIKIQDREIGVKSRTPEQKKFMAKVEEKIGSGKKQHSSSSLLRGETVRPKSVTSVINKFGVKW